jgi:hypothetical protein
MGALPRARIHLPTHDQGLNRERNIEPSSSGRLAGFFGTIIRTEVSGNRVGICAKTLMSGMGFSQIQIEADQVNVSANVKGMSLSTAYLYPSHSTVTANDIASTTRSIPLVQRHQRYGAR